MCERNPDFLLGPTTDYGRGMIILADSKRFIPSLSLARAAPETIYITSASETPRGCVIHGSVLTLAESLCVQLSC